MTASFILKLPLIIEWIRIAVTVHRCYKIKASVMPECLLDKNIRVQVCRVSICLKNMDSRQKHAGMTDSILPINGYELPRALEAVREPGNWPKLTFRRS